MPDWLPDEWTLEALFTLCAGLGGLVTLGQVVLGLFGLGVDALDATDALDAADALDHSDGLQFFSVRALSAFLLMFGLGGLTALSADFSPALSVVIATLSGGSTLVLVAWLLSLQAKLVSTGTMEPIGAVGGVARVYLRIPAAGEGTGKITVELQGRSAQYDAFTEGAELPTGAEVRVLEMTTPGSFKVESLHPNGS